ncbi:sensor histidine kinase [Rugosimonospora africana]|uniref:histidine kinase n=1 Tax=Rugosimonospora africana TaxID=556532 RepID=A0A8J3VR77_9ACTN|nr:HAMP domain-containing sensor histidine kinase [Rugosimonospora africana]GIH15895.1 sensor histidine kinase [Rugosimonospora africana]
MTPRVQLLRTAIGEEHDVFVVRQRGREVASAIGLESQDQIRVATALSEVGRQLFARLGPVLVVFDADTGPSPGLVVSATARLAGEPGEVDALADEVAVAQRLVDTWQLDQESGQVVITLGRTLPATAPALTPARIEELRGELAVLVPSRPVEEFVVQNQHLLATLDQVQSHRDQLLRLNAELEETNRGVLALYNELSEELEATNRGVVALYAELDEKSAQLREASEAKTRFLANVSHELRAPVTAVLGLVRLVTDPGSDPLTAEQRTQLDLIRDSAQDMLVRVNELLDLAKAESGRLEPVPVEVDLHRVFHALAGTMRSLATRPEVTVVVEEPDGLPALVTDETMLIQVLRNLMTNGIKFTVRGEVRLAGRLRDDDRLDLVVSDTGIGIPEAEHEHVFEEFYQIRGEVQAGTVGTGLGLPYARRLAALLGGELTLASTVGEGSTFTVTLPLRTGTG